MSKGVYVLQTCNQHKSYASAKSVGYFTEEKSSQKKVLHKIKKEWKTYFDSKEELDQFVSQVEENGIVKTLNSNTDIYAMCVWVEEIT